jgi:hypothetical protein
MKTLLVAFSIVVWTLCCGAAWLLLEPTIAFLQANADWLGAWPELLYWTRWALELIAQSGAVLIGLVWALGIAGILFASWAVALLWRRFSAAASPLPGSPPSADPQRTVSSG